MTEVLLTGILSINPINQLLIIGAIFFLLFIFREKFNDLFCQISKTKTNPQNKQKINNWANLEII